MTPRWPQDGHERPQDGPKMAPRWPQDGPAESHITRRCFYMARRGPKMAPRWPREAPRWPQNGPKMAPRWPQDGLKIAQDGPVVKHAFRHTVGLPQKSHNKSQDNPKTDPKWPDLPPRISALPYHLVTLVALSPISSCPPCHLVILSFTMP